MRITKLSILAGLLLMLSACSSEKMPPKQLSTTQAAPATKIFRPLVQKTTFTKEEEAYGKSLFERGHNYAMGVHWRCPPDPNYISNVDGKDDWSYLSWVQGFEQGALDGGESPLPKRYERYVSKANQDLIVIDEQY